jgi:hypothetical protein
MKALSKRSILCVIDQWTGKARDGLSGSGEAG